MKKMLKQAQLCADKIYENKNNKIKVTSHIDADGITSAGVICKTLERAGIEYDVQFVKQLDDLAIDALADEGNDLNIFTDLGSGMLDQINAHDMNIVVSDHHEIHGETECHINPHMFGLNGSHAISGVGTTYLVSNMMDRSNYDLADIVMVGAIGDMQNRKFNRLEMLNREIMEYGKKHGVVNNIKDLSMFGKQTRPVHKMIEFASDPYLPGLTGNEDACIDFLHGIKADYVLGETPKLWYQLNPDEKRKIVTGIMQYCLRNSIPSYKTERLLTESYILCNEEEGTELRDAMEYSTLLNSTGRYEEAEIGLSVVMGDREVGFDNAKNLLAQHRKNLVDGMKFVKENGIIELDNFQYFYSGKRIPQTIVGIVAGMCMSSVPNRHIPIIGMSDTDEGDKIKISARGTQDLIRRGLNLSVALNEVTSQFEEGVGGGHDIAAGATIKIQDKDKFIELFNQKLGEQLKT
jgi:RecJ-like exonuclease